MPIVCYIITNQYIMNGGGLSRVSTLQQDLRQQTEEILREVYKDGYKEDEVIVI